MTEAAREHARAIAATAPPFSVEQRARLALLLGRTGQNPAQPEPFAA